MKFTKVVVSEENKEILKRILDAYQLSWIDLESRIRVMLAQAFVTNKYLKFFKPKFVITSCYSNFSEVLASRQNNIQTIELQHGIISRLHPGYESLFKLNKDFTADHLLVFGDNSIKELDDNIVNRDKSFVVGNYYLDVLKTTPKNQAILEMISGYALSVSVPTDFLTENGILDFILEVAGKRPDILFLIVPRTSITDKGTALVANFKNIKVVSQHSFQDVVRHTTFHTATNSTCCLEALFFGIPNLLIDREGGVKELYGSLTDVRFTKFLSSPEEYIETITHWKHADCSEISESNRNNFAVDYKSNLINAFRKIGVI